MYKTLRIVRIVVAAAVAVVFALVYWDVAGLGRSVSAWLENMQIVPALMTASVGWILIWLVVTLLFGRIYCSAICPLGSLMDACSAVANAARGRKGRKVYRYRGSITWIRILAVLALVEAGSLGFTLMVSVLDPAANFERACKVFGVLSATGYVGGGLVLGVLIAVAAMHKGRVLCNTVCPVGAILGGVTRLSMLSFDINPDLCTHCGKCEEVCKSRCIRSTESIVDNSRCVTCFNCTAVCPNGAITWRAGKHRLSWPLLQKIVSWRARTAPTSMATPDNAQAPEAKINKCNETILRPTEQDSPRGHAEE